MDTDGLVREYIGRLDAAAAGLPAERRSELETEVREHIETALQEAGSRDEVAVRNVLERLGSPVDIVAAESDGIRDRLPENAAAQSVTTQRFPRAWGATEIIALLLLTVGAIVLPFLGPLLGLIFVWLSDIWTRNQKLIATAIVLVLLLLPIGLLFGASTIGSGIGGPQIMSPEPYAP
jgi:uncharacterized membrane protein